MPTPPEPTPTPLLLDDVIRLEHMVLAGRDVTLFCAGATRDRLDQDRMFQRAVIHAIQEIGEAATRVTAATRSLLPSVPWGSIVQMRNIVVHVYWGVDLDRVWVVATTHVPVLLTEVGALLARAQPFEQE